MARKLRLPDGLPRRVVLWDNYDYGTWSGSGTVHVLYLDDDEPHPRTKEELHAFLLKDRVITKDTPKVEADMIAAVGAARADASKAAWKARRMNP